MKKAQLLRLEWLSFFVYLFKRSINTVRVRV